MNRIPLFQTILTTFTLLAWVATGSAKVTLRLDNGDSISGELLASDGKQVRLRVDYLGEVNLPIDRIANLAEVFPTVDTESLEGKASVGSTVVATKSVENVEIVEDGSFPHSVLPLHGWKKRLQLGMTAQSGRDDKTDLYYRFDMQRTREKHQYRLDAEYFYGKTGDTITSSKFKSDFRWRQDIGPGVFYQSTTSYGSDEVKLIDANLEQKLGLGLRFIETDTMTISSGAGGNSTAKLRKLPIS